MEFTEIQDGEIAQLRAFRRAAAQVRTATVVQNPPERLGFHLAASVATVERDAEGYAALFRMKPDSFKAFLLALRQTYMQGERAHFYSVANILRRRGDDDVRQQVDAIRAAYTGALDSREIDLRPRGQALTAGEVFHTWLYGGAFHDDDDKRTLWRELDRMLGMADFVVQATAIRLAGCVLALDDLVALIVADEA